MTRRFVLACILAPLAVLAALAVLVPQHGGPLRVDEPVVELLNLLAPVSSEEVHIDPILEVAALVAGALTAALVLRLLVSRELVAAAFVVAAIVIPVLLSWATKALVERPPIEGPADGYSFPSGSATWSMATVVVVVLLAGTVGERRRLAVAGAAFAVGYGAIITWEQWHYPSDVVAGWCLALAVSSALWLASHRPRATVLSARWPRRSAEPTRYDAAAARAGRHPSS